MNDEKEKLTKQQEKRIEDIRRKAQKYGFDVDARLGAQFEAALFSGDPTAVYFDKPDVFDELEEIILRIERSKREVRYFWIAVVCMVCSVLSAAIALVAVVQK